MHLIPWLPSHSYSEWGAAGEGIVFMRIDPIQSGEISRKSAKPHKKPEQFRLLSTLIRSAVSCGILSESNFFNHFSLVQLMDGLNSDSIARAVLLKQTTGLHVAVGKKKSASECANDLCLALEENETNFVQIARLFPWEVCIRGVGANVLWKVLDDCVEQALKKEAEGNRSEADLVQKNLSAFVYQVLLAAVELGMMRSAAATATLTCHQIVEYLPTEHLVDVMAEIVQGAAGRPGLARQRYFDIVDPSEFVKLTPLHIVWRMVIVEHVAQPLGWQND